MRHYALSMGLRVLAFPAGAIAFVNGWHLIGTILVLFAVFIPAAAVAFANAVDRRSDPGALDPIHRPSLQGGATDPGSVDPIAPPEPPDTTDTTDTPDTMDTTERPS